VHWILFGDTTGATFGNFNDWCDGAAGAYATAFVNWNRIQGHLHFTRVKASLCLHGGAAKYRTVRVVDQSGDGSGGEEPAQVCILVDWVTGDPRRGGKARSYIAGVDASAMDDEVRLNGDTQTTGTAKANAYIAALAAITHGPLAGGQLVEMSFVNALDYRAAAVEFPVIAGFVSAEVATQRRRVDRLRT
jgi:hypothetical protein